MARRPPDRSTRATSSKNMAGRARWCKISSNTMPPKALSLNGNICASHAISAQGDAIKSVEIISADASFRFPLPPPISRIGSPHRNRGKKTVMIVLINHAQ